MPTKEELKEQYNKITKNANWWFKLFIKLGIIQFEVLYNEHRLGKWGYKYRTVWFNPLTWIALLPVLIVGLIGTLYQALEHFIKDELTWKEFW